MLQVVRKKVIEVVLSSVFNYLKIKLKCNISYLFQILINGVIRREFGATLHFSVFPFWS